MNKKKILIISASALLLYFIANSFVGYGNFYFVNSVLGYDQKQLIKKYIFPYKTIAQQEVLIKKLDPLYEQIEFKKSNKNITFLKDTKLSNNKILKRYQLVDGFKHKINHKTISGSGYIDFHKNNILVLSPLGIIGYSKNLEDNENFFLQIQNNIDDFIGLQQFKKNHRLTLKDLHIHKDKIYISYTEEIEQDCWNTSVISADMNYKNIFFKKIFSSDKCVHTKFKVDKGFSGNQSGGRIVNFDDNHILLSVGEYRERWLSQDINHINGKVLKININNSKYEIVSIGHRNPQGLYFDKENNFILETEHGPHGGDEINLIKVSDINKEKPLNYGWAIVSEGSHYCLMEEYRGVEECDIITVKYPLYNSHSKYGYIEPLKSFNPSVGISEILKIEGNKYVVAAMGKEEQGGKALYFFEINNETKLVNLEKVDVYERVRDIKIYKNKLYLFLGDSSSIGVINLN